MFYFKVKKIHSGSFNVIATHFNTKMSNSAAPRCRAETTSSCGSGGSRPYHHHGNQGVALLVVRGNKREAPWSIMQG